MQHIGYKRDSNKKNKLIIDEYSAGIVRKIFEMYANGHGSIDILNMLNTANIETPSVYNKHKKKPSTKWNQTTILSILKNQVYIGNSVQNKINKISYKSKKIIKVPEEKWVIVENTHEPIIDKELFDKVQLIINGRDTSKLTKHEYLFKGFIECYHCNRKLQIVLKSSGKKKVKNPYINCIGHEKRGKHPISMNYWKFEAHILEAIRKICKIYLDDPMFIETYKKYKLKSKNILDGYNKQFQNIQNKIDEINSDLDKMYFDKLKGIISENDYIRYSEKVSLERENLINRQIELKEKIDIILGESKEDINETEIKEIIKGFLELKTINKTILYRLIQKIVIDKDKNIYIYFNFNSLNIISDNEKLKDGMIDIEQIKKVG